MAAYVGDSDPFPTEKVTDNNFEELLKTKPAFSCIRAVHTQVMFLNLTSNVCKAFF